MLFSGGGGLVAKSGLTLAIPWTVCSQPHSSVHCIFQARILEWFAISFSPGNLPNPGIKPGCPALQADSLLTELPGPNFLQCSYSTLSLRCRHFIWKDFLKYNLLFISHMYS